MSTTLHKTRFVKMTPTERMLAAYVHLREGGIGKRDAIIRLWTFMKTWKREDRRELVALIRAWERDDMPEAAILEAS
jgi:hypothetical protein